MQICPIAQDPCCCVPITTSPCPPPCPPPRSSDSSDCKDSKYYQEVGAEMIGNQLIIRIEKDKNRSKKRRDQWDPPCDCETVEIVRGKEGPKILNANSNNRILFRIHSKNNVRTDDPAYKPHTIAYEVGACKGGKETNDQCRTITVYPQLGSSGSQIIHSDRVTEGNENVFFLRIKKKPDATETSKRNMEVELRTPKVPSTPNLVTDTDTSVKLQLDTQECARHEEKSNPALRKGKKKRKSIGIKKS